jgi:FkbM family methyltransferase
MAEHERSTQIQYIDEYNLDKPIILKKYRELTEGLDEKSIETINLMLKRLRIILCNKEGKYFDFFSEEEQKKINELNNNFNNKIFKLSDGLFSYKKYLLPEKYFEPIVFYYKYGLNELKKKQLSLSEDILDIGAYIGDSTLMFSKIAYGNVYAWDPMEENCEKIKETARINNCLNIKIVQCACGEKTSRVFIEKNKQLNWSTMKPYNCRDYDHVKVDMKSIDDFVEENDLRISLIKLHVEGMEFESLRGAINTLKKQKPALIIHIHHTPKDFWEIKPWIQQLDLGYKFKIFKAVDGCIFTGGILIAEAY